MFAVKIAETAKIGGCVKSGVSGDSEWSQFSWLGIT